MSSHSQQPNNPKQLRVAHIGWLASSHLVRRAQELAKRGIYTLVFTDSIPEWYKRKQYLFDVEILPEQLKDDPLAILNWLEKRIVAHKIDILHNDNDLIQVEDFIEENAQKLLDIKPEIFPISSRKALLSKQGQPELWLESRFELLENYIQSTLDEKGRLKLKLLNPLGVGLFLADRYLNVTNSRLDLLRTDFQMISDVESQLGVYSEDMHRDFNFRMSDVENVLFEMEQRGEDYFDETFRLPRLVDLLNKDRIKNEFETQVVSDSPQIIERKVDELIDWLVDSELRQWQAVNEHLAERRRVHKDRILGETMSKEFHYQREQLIAALGSETQRVVDSYDKTKEATAIAQDAQTAVAASAALEVGAIGLGALVSILATTAAADVTGILMASIIAILGLFVIPARRRIAKAEMREKISKLRLQLINTLTNQFEKEIERSIRNIQDTIAPYTRFVRAERENLSQTHTRMKKIKKNLARIRNEIKTL